MNKMKNLNIAIKDIIQQHGAEVIRDTQLVNLLDDMHAFTGPPATRLVLHEMIRLGYGERLYALYQSQNPSWDEIIKFYTYEIVNIYGFREDITTQVLTAISWALKFLNSANLSTEVTDEELASCITDEYGAKYSADGLKLLKVPYDYERTTYEVKDGTMVICDRAFFWCSSLTSIVLPNSVTSIGESAFRGCRSLTRISLPNSVTSIGKRAFSGCSSLTSIALPDGVTSIESAFAGCNCKITCFSPHFKVHDDALFTADMHTLLYCPASKTSFIIPDGLTSIGDSAFFWCSSLTSIALPNSVTSIGKSAFSRCSSLTSIAIPNSVTSIGQRVFWGCRALTSITIPNSVTSIGDGAFAFCSRLTSIALPNSVTSIGNDAFWACSLRIIYIPAGSYRKFAAMLPDSKKELLVEK